MALDVAVNVDVAWGVAGDKGWFSLDCDFVAADIRGIRRRSLAFRVCLQRTPGA